MNVFLYELKAYRKTVIIWTCTITALALLYMLLYKGLGKDLEQFKVFMNNLPDIMKKIFNLYISSITTLVGFFSFIFTFVLLCGAIQAMNIGTSIVSKEVRDNTADFLMTKPLSRAEILSSKILAALCCLVITNIIYLGVTIPFGAAMSKDFDIKLYLLLSASLFFVQLIFMAMGIIVSVIARKIKSVISISLSTVFGFYIIGSLGSIIGEANVRYLSPFRYFDAAYIIQNASYEASFVIVGSIFVIAAIAASFVVFLKKDIHSV
jgi:ABC-2 type transport system permease protein